MMSAASKHLFPVINVILARRRVEIARQNTAGLARAVARWGCHVPRRHQPGLDDVGLGVVLT